MIIATQCKSKSTPGLLTPVHIILVRQDSACAKINIHSLFPLHKLHERIYIKTKLCFTITVVSTA